MTPKQLIALQNVLVLAKEAVHAFDREPTSADDIIARDSIKMIQEMVHEEVNQATELYKKGYE
jgi:hypothetical protein